MGARTSSKSIHPLLSKVGQDLYTPTIVADRTRTATQEETKRSQKDATSSKIQPSCSSPKGWTRPTINLHADNCSGQNKNCYIMYEGSKKLAGSVGLTPPLRSDIQPLWNVYTQTTAPNRIADETNHSRQKFILLAALVKEGSSIFSMLHMIREHGDKASSPIFFCMYTRTNAQLVHT